MLPPSRAGSLPQGIGGVRSFCDHLGGVNDAQPVARGFSETSHRTAGLRSSPKKAGVFLQKNRCATEREQAPSPESWALRRLVYSPSAMLPPSYESLRHCLQLRQNPPACAPCPWVLSFPCHCPSVVGFSSPEVVTVA